jgi:hypothetical protein
MAMGFTIPQVRQGDENFSATGFPMFKLNHKKVCQRNSLQKQIRVL